MIFLDTCDASAKTRENEKESKTNDPSDNKAVIQNFTLMKDKAPGYIEVKCNMETVHEICVLTVTTVSLVTKKSPQTVTPTGV